MGEIISTGAIPTFIRPESYELQFYYYILGGQIAKHSENDSPSLRCINSIVILFNTRINQIIAPTSQFCVSWLLSLHGTVKNISSIGILIRLHAFT